MKDCSLCIHYQNPGRDYESSPCAKCRTEEPKRQVIREPNYDIERNYAASNLIRRLKTVRTDILIFMLEHPDLSQIEMSKRMGIPRSTLVFHYHRIRRVLPELF